jgi:drug/metabolite transporter (DMT)-like permease
VALRGEQSKSSTVTTVQSWRPDEETTGVLLALVSAACFGTLAIFGKIATEVGLDTTTLLTYRFLIGTVFIWLGLVLSGRARLLPGRECGTALGLGLLYAIFTGFYFWGLLFIPAGLTGLVFYTYPVYVYVLAVGILGESVSRYKLGALVVALSGMTLIVGADVGAVDTVGVGLIVLAALGIAGYIVGSRAALDSIESDILAGTAMLATTTFFFVFGIASGRLGSPDQIVTGDIAHPVGLDQWLVVLGIASVGTALPIFLYLIALNRIEASHASVLGTAEPLVTVVLGIVVLGESLTPILVVGGVLILAGVVVVQADVGTESTLPD